MENTYPCSDVVDTFRPRQKVRRRHFQMYFLEWKCWIPIKISMKFVSKGPINNIPSLVQIMDRRRAGDKPLYESVMVSLLTHICVTRPQWVSDIIVTLKAESCQGHDTIFVNAPFTRQSRNISLKGEGRPWDVYTALQKFGITLVSCSTRGNAATQMSISSRLLDGLFQKFLW